MKQLDIDKIPSDTWCGLQIGDNIHITSVRINAAIDDHIETQSVKVSSDEMSGVLKIEVCKPKDDLPNRSRGMDLDIAFFNEGDAHETIAHLRFHKGGLFLSKSKGDAIPFNAPDDWEARDED